MQQQNDGQPSRVPQREMLRAREQRAVDHRGTNQRLEQQEVIPAGGSGQGKNYSFLGEKNSTEKKTTGCEVLGKEN